MPSDISTVPFWRADHPRPDRPPERLPAKVDVAVVGAGYTGLNAAREIAASGASVLVLDAGPVGAGASSVNGGMVNYGLKAKASKIYKTFGPALGREFWDSALSSIDLVADLVTEHGIDCSFVRGGAAQLGYNDRDLHHFEAQAEWYLGKLDYSCDVVGPDRIRGVIDSPTIRCAVIDTVGAGLHPAAVRRRPGRGWRRRQAPSWPNTPPSCRSPATPADTQCSPNGARSTPTP